MRLLAGLAAGLFVYLALGSLFGVSPSWLRKTRERRSAADGWREWLQQADADVTPVQFLGVSLGLGVAVGLVIGAAVGVPALGVVAGAVAMAFPRMVFARRRSALVQQRLAAWPDAIRDIITHLRASLSMHASLCEVGRSGPVPLRPYFNRYAGLSGALDQRAALEVVREDLADPMSDRVIEVLLVAFDQGSSVVIDILHDLAASSSEDLRLLDEIETLQLETKLEARGAAVLPFVVLAMLCVFTPGYRSFYATPAGWFVIGLGACMSLGGLLVIRHLGRVPTEERILAVGTPT